MDYWGGGGGGKEYVGPLSNYSGGLATLPCRGGKKDSVASDCNASVYIPSWFRPHA